MTTWSCCNCEEGCVWDWRVPQDPDESLCLHTTNQELRLTIPRPKYQFQWQWIQLIDSGPFACPCTGINFGYGLTASEEDDIVGKYSHYDGSGSGSAQATSDFPWFYDHGGTPGTDGINPGNLWPDATDTIPAGVIPCCGYDQGAGSPDDADCASGGYTSTSQCSSYRWTKGSSGSRFCTRHMQEVIDTGTSPAKDPTNTNLEDCIHYGNEYKWLQGVADNSDSEKFPHWEWNGSAVVALDTSGTATHYMAETLLAIFHQEIWWENYSNSLYDEDPGNPATCRIPKYWMYACGGIPIYTWEIMDVHYDDLDDEMSTNSPEDIIEFVSEGLPLTTEMTSAMVTVGLLQLGDWSQADGEPIKKTVKYHDGRAWRTATRYYFARPGGWDFVCPGATNNTPMENRWPQIVRNFSTYTPDCCGGAPPCSGSSIMNWAGNYACFSAAPFPNSTEVCWPGTGNCGGHGGGGIDWDACDGTPPTNCQQGTTKQGRYNVDQWSASCNGILMRYSVYCADNWTQGTDPWSCCLKNDATLCVVAPGSDQCKLDLETLTENLWHYIPEVVSQSWRNGWGTSSDELCCGGEGQFQWGSVICPAPTPQASDCTYPETI